MNRSTVNEQISESGSQFPTVVMDDNNVTDNRSQRNKRNLYEVSMDATPIC